GYLSTGILLQFLVSYSSTKFRESADWLISSRKKTRRSERRLPKVHKKRRKNNMTEQVQLTQQDIDTMHDVLETLFSEVEIDGTFELVENDGIVEVMLDTKDTGIVIGYHGEVLESLQLIASLMVAKKIGKFVRL